MAPRLRLSTPNESPRRGTGTMAVAVPEGKPAGDPDQRRPGRLRRRGRPVRLGASRGRRRSRPTRWPPGTAVVPVLFTAASGGPGRGNPGHGRRPARRPQARRPQRIRVRPPSWSWARTTSPSGPARWSRWPSPSPRRPPSRSRRRAEGAARAGRVDGPQGGRQAQARLHRPDRRLAPLEPPGHRLQARGRHPREPERGDDPAQRQHRGAS